MLRLPTVGSKCYAKMLRCNCFLGKNFLGGIFFLWNFFFDLGVQNWIFPKLNISKNTPYYSDLKPDYEIKNNSLQTDIHSLI